MPAQPGAGRAAPGKRLTLALVGVLCGIWGSTYLVIHEGLADLPPFTAAAARFLIAGAVFALVARPLSRFEGGAPPTLFLVAIVGVLNVAIAYAVIYWCETVLPSGLVSLLWAVFPLLLALLARIWLPEERLGARQWTGLAVGFAGMALVFATDLVAVGPAAVPAGAVLLLSPLAAALGNLTVKRYGAGTSSVLLNRGGMLLGGVLLGVLALATEDLGVARWTPMALASVAYLSLVGTVVAFGLYFWLLRYAPAHQLALIAYVTPVLALILGATFAGEPVGLHTVAGAALILGGVALVLRKHRPRTG